MYIVEISSYAARKIKKFTQQQKDLFDILITKLKIDPFAPSLRTYKLSGILSGKYACSIDYKNRAIFIIIERDVITIIDVGSHDEVYGK